jgi:hypothetical protein
MVLVFFALQLSGALGIFALLATVSAGIVKRSMTWSALCVSLIVYSLSYSAVSVDTLCNVWDRALKSHALDSSLVTSPVHLLRNNARPKLH